LLLLAGYWQSRHSLKIDKSISATKCLLLIVVAGWLLAESPLPEDRQINLCYQMFVAVVAG